MSKLVKANTVEIRPIDWLWYGRFPLRCLSTCEGDPGTSKSTLTATMAAHVTKGEDWPDGEACPVGSAIIANAEDPEDSVVVPRLMAAGANLDKVSVITPGTALFQIPDNVKALEEQICDEDVKLLVFDPMESYLSLNVNSKDNQVIRHAFHSLERLAERVNCCIIIVRHLIKDTGKTSIYRGGGSIAVIAAARASTLVVADPADKTRKIMIPHKANWSAARPGLAYRIEEVEFVSSLGEAVKTTKLVWAGEVKGDSNQLLQPSTDIEASVEVTEAAVYLRERLAMAGEDGVSSSKLFREAAKLGFERKVLYRAMGFIGGEKIPVAENEWIWKLSA